MTRRDALATLIGVPVMGMNVPESGTNECPQGCTIAMGQLTSSDHEMADGMFAVGQATAIMTKPESVGWLRLRELRGRTVTLYVRVDA